MGVLLSKLPNLKHGKAVFFLMLVRKRKLLFILKSTALEVRLCVGSEVKKSKRAGKLSIRNPAADALAFETGLKSHQLSINN